MPNDKLIEDLVEDLRPSCEHGFIKEDPVENAINEQQATLDLPGIKLLNKGRRRSESILADAADRVRHAEYLAKEYLRHKKPSRRKRRRGPRVLSVHKTNNERLRGRPINSRGLKECSRGEQKEKKF